MGSVGETRITSQILLRYWRIAVYCDENKKRNPEQVDTDFYRDVEQQKASNFPE